MFLCKLNKGISHFKNVFDLYGQIGISEVFFDIKKSGIYIYTTHDKSIHAMAVFNSTSFLEYKCEKECVYIMAIDSMKTNFKNNTNIDMVELSIKKEGELKVKVSHKTIEFENKVKLKETQFYEVPLSLVQVQPLNIKASDFLALCRTINGKHNLTISSNNTLQKCIAFESDTSRTVIKIENDEDCGEILPYNSEFKAEYFPKLKKFTKFNSSPHSNSLRIFLNPNQPLILESPIGLNANNKDKITIWIKSIKQIEKEYEEQD